MARKPNKPSMKERRRGPGVAKLEQIINSQLNHPLPNPFQHFQNGSGFWPFWFNPYVFGAPDYTRVLSAGSNSETSNELFSVPKLIPHYHSPPFHVCCQDVEVATVHRKMEAKGRKIFMEYEFFLEKDKEEEMVVSQNPKASSCLTPSTPNSVDLSLKLSF